MPKGFAAAAKVGSNKGGYGFQPRPQGVTYFALKDGQSAKVRFIQQHAEIDWARKWKLAPSAKFKYGELVNCVDQYEDGTLDPGYAAGLSSTFKAYPVMIWRGAPTYQKDPEGKFTKHPVTKQKIPTGVADQVAVWETSYANYEMMRELDEKYGGLMSRDFEIKRIGGGTDTKYMFLPDGDSSPITPADSAIIAAGRVDVSEFTKVPTYEELNAYLNGGVPEAATPTFDGQVQQNAAPHVPNPLMPPSVAAPAPPPAIPGIPSVPVNPFMQ